MNSPRQLYKFLLQKKGHIADLITQAEINLKLSKSLNNLLDPTLVDHIHLATIRAQTLVLMADSSVWASRTRYFSPLLLQKLQNNSHLFGDVKRIEIHVQPATQDDHSEPPPPRHISDSAAKCLTATAEGIENTALKTALNRLANRKNRGNE